MGIRLVMWLRVARPQMLGPDSHGPLDFESCLVIKWLNYNTKNYMRGLKNIEGGMFRNRGGGVLYGRNNKGVGGLIWFWMVIVRV